MPMFDFQCTICHSVTESLEKSDVQSISCVVCGWTAQKTILKAPTWHFAEMQGGKWAGNAVDALKKRKNNKKKKLYFYK